jgi:hypothetical protein
MCYCRISFIISYLYKIVIVRYWVVGKTESRNQKPQIANQTDCLKSAFFGLIYICCYDIHIRTIWFFLNH